MMSCTAEIEATRARRPPTFPPTWADAWGDDAFGLWAEFHFEAVVQRMRWIEPGEFWMGSPDDEPGRFDGEGPRHRVRLTQGFWLADSACTQGLWQAVCGDNPSHFKGDVSLPVEQVSWDDVQNFNSRLQEGLLGAGELMLPSEAQWEYACRAGTQTPFSFGDNVSPQQVNYDGGVPYAGGAKGLYRERTVPVKSLPANRWGSYEMHGNLWEWCADDMRNFARTAVEGGVLDDPLGPVSGEQGAPRAVRGGAWFSPARDLRSAYRRRFERGYRFPILGFRVALRS